MTLGEVRVEAARLGAPGAAALAYYGQVARARRRGIEWDFTFSGWWAWWQTDNRWERRGGKADQLVMGRKGDEGPYRSDNVVALTMRQNSSDGGRRARGRKPPAAVSAALLHIPVFAGNALHRSANAAATAHGLSWEVGQSWAWRKVNGWRYAFEELPPMEWPALLHHYRDAGRRVRPRPAAVTAGAAGAHP